MEQTKIPEENVDIENMEIGEDKPQIQPGPVLVGGYRIDPVKKKDTEKVIGKKLVLICKIADRDEPLEISQVKYQQGDKLKQSGLWINIDSDGKMPYRSATACMLRKIGTTKISGLKGAKLETVEGDNGYLVIKAY